ncbi:MAG: DUF218 domain-containing protein [Opitutaceae bacterium]|nr:DUF218 domain-containing protein [Opitutaceae bacterium]
MFLFKKLVGHFISPVFFGIGLVILGLWLHWRGKSVKLSRTFLATGILIPLLAFNSGFADLLNRHLEYVHDAMPVQRNMAIPDLKFLVVLGGGHVENPQLSSLTQLVNPSRSRVVEGVRLARLYPEATLLVCGPQGTHHSRPHAAFLAESAIELGVSPDRIMQLSSGRDTRGEILEISSVVGGQSIGLVTSAWHMPRSMALAAEVGLNATACPADYRTQSPKSTFGSWFTFYPPAYETTSRALREYVGILWLNLRG